MTKAHLEARKKKLYEMLYTFTFDQCGYCVESGCACKDSICAHVAEQAAKRGHKFQPTGYPIRFIGPRGCIVPPHLRETCTIYLCQKAQAKPTFDQKRYARLKNLCDSVEWKLMELDETLRAKSP